MGNCLTLQNNIIEEKQKGYQYSFICGCLCNKNRPLKAIINCNMDNMGEAVEKRVYKKLLPVYIIHCNNCVFNLKYLKGMLNNKISEIYDGPDIRSKCQSPVVRV